MADLQAKTPPANSKNNSTSDSLIAEHTRQDRRSASYLSPQRLLFTIVISIFVAEVIAMIIVYFLKTLPYQVTVLIDASIMLVMIVPVLYFLSFQPLLSHIRRSEQAEQALKKRNRALGVLNECNQLLLHARQEDEFLQQMCEIIVKTGQYRMAWIGFAWQDEARSVHVVAQFGFESGYLEQAHISWGDNELGQGPTGTAIRQAMVQVNQNFLTNPKTEPWRESALSRGYQASIALPLQSEGSTIGALTIYSALPEAFDSEEVQLLDELANNLTFGITALRVRAQRQQVEERNRQLSRIVEQTEDTVVVTDPSGIIEYINPAFERRTGYTREEALGKTPRVIKSGLHNRKYYQTLWETILRGEVFQKEIANRKKNGELFYEIKTITPLRDTDGNITHFVATGKDITEHKRDEEKLQQAYSELEIRVQKRTEELRIAVDELRVANSELEGEIVERKRVEEALRGSERRLNRSQEIAHLGSWELDLASGQLTWSDEVYRIFGLQPQQFAATYEAFLEVVHPDDRQAVDEAYSSSVKNGNDGYEIEHRIIKQATGEIRIVHEKCEHFRDEAGKIIRSAGMVHDITERKQAEEALHRFELLSEHSRDIMLFMRLEDGRILEANRAALQAYGYSHEEFLDLSIQDLRDVNTADLTADQMTQANIQGILFETTHRRKDGSLFPVEVSSQGATIGSTRTLVSIVRDISERRRAEEALRQSEESFSKAFRSSPTALLITRLEDGRFMEVNDAYCELVGYQRNELLGHRTTDFNIYIKSTDRQAIVKRLQEKGSIRDFEISIHHRSGELRHLVAGQELITFNGEDCVLSTAMDITERRLAEEALRRAHDELEVRVQERTQELVKEIAEREEIERQMRIQTTAMEAAANGIVITDRQGVIEWTNPALAQISGYSTEELLGQSMKIFNSGEQDSAYYQELWKVILDGDVWRGEITNRRKDGSCYIEEQIITPVRGHDNQITHFISIKQDITARKQAEKDIQERNQKEKVLTETIHTMQLDIARDLHDTIGQNISFLRMKLDYLAEKEIRKKAEIQAELRNMARAANESYDLIRGTLALLQSEHSADLFRLFTRYAEQIEERASVKIECSSEGEPRFMPAKRMRQLFYIFREILNNIEKHANASQVSMVMTWNSDALTLAVFDNGNGFDPSSVQYGSHYGLKFMRERAEILNGSLLIRSESGTGTKIVLQVPYE